MIRCAVAADIDSVNEIYQKIHRAEAAGELTIGWDPKKYPVRHTAEEAQQAGELFVMEEEGHIVGAAILNHTQWTEYRGVAWQREAPDEEVLVMHTLVIDPEESRKGYGSAFARFYETYAREQGCTDLRIDTQAKNAAARRMYRGLGYKEAAIVPAEFHGISGIDLVLLEKML